VLDFVKKETDNTESQLQLSQAFPKKVLSDESKTLAEYGISKKENLVVEVKS